MQTIVHINPIKLALDKRVTFVELNYLKGNLMLCMGMACQSNFEGERYFLTKTFSNRFFCYVFFF